MGISAGAQVPISLPSYKQGHYENDTILKEYGTLTPTGNAAISIDPELNANFITGIAFKMVVDSISLGGAASVNVGDTLLIPVSFQLFTGSIGFHIIIEGTPEIARESYFCDLALFFTTGLDWGAFIAPASYDSCFVESSQGIKKFYDTETLKIFPNPASESVKIMATGNETLSGIIELFNSAGKIVKSQVINGGKVLEVDVRDLSAGIYIFRFSSGSKVQTIEFVKQ